MPNDYEMMEEDQPSSEAEAPETESAEKEDYGDHVCTINKSIKPDAKVGDIIKIKVDKVYEDEFSVVPAGEEKKKPAPKSEPEAMPDMMEE